MTKQKKNAPQWFTLRDQVLRSIGLLNSPINDRKTIDVMAKVTSVLMAGQALPDGQRNTFLECIRRRTKHVDFKWNGPIVLTDNQRKRARKTGKDRIVVSALATPVSSAFHPSDGRDELLEAFQLLFRHISSEGQPDFTQLSSILGARPAELLEAWWLNEINGNEINHERAMICPQDDMRLASSPVRHEEVILAHEPAAPAHLHAISDMRESDRGDRPPKPARPAPSSSQATISYFHNDPAKEPSAVLEYKGQRYSLVFSTVDRAEAKVHAISPEWLKQMDEYYLADIRAECRIDERIGSIRRFVMSPIYAERDTFGKATIAHVPEMMALLGWNENNEPEAVFIVDGLNITEVPLKRFASTHAKGPSFKGAFAVQDAFARAA